MTKGINIGTGIYYIYQEKIFECRIWKRWHMVTDFSDKQGYAS